MIILCEASHTLPFDIKNQRVIFYDLRPRSLHEHVHRKEERFTDTVSAGALPLKVIRETERS